MILRTELLKHPDPEAASLTLDISDAACPICVAPDTLHLCEVDGHQILRCPHCATDFVFPVPDHAALQAYYDRAAWFEGGERGGYQNYDEQTAPVLPFFDAVLDSFGTDAVGLSILDVGCGYGTHLAKAYQRGWKCFGVEISAHARQVAAERHGNTIFVVDDVDHLIPHAFDLIILFDVIEHLADPYHLFYTLFAKGAITPKTKVIISTPNARSLAAVARPADWAYRHPPSHLMYFSAQALTVLLQRLHFASIEVSGLHGEKGPDRQCYPDESFALNDGLAQYAGIVCTASGSDFAGFMQERYVPGTWSKIAEYEHLPRYMFAKVFAANARVLDFGCGTGYGSALLATAAQSVAGLDIDAAALRWARQTHRNTILNFEQRDDLGAGLQDQSFDLITCFEMIEHVAHPMQIDTIRNVARLLTPTGKFVISTPNPEVTAKYGDNQYHLREMSEAEFLELLSPHFAHVRILRQWVAPSILIAEQSNPQWGTARFDEFASDKAADRPLAYIAICSHAPLAEIVGLCEFDRSIDFIQVALEAEKNLNEQRFASYQAREQSQNLIQQIGGYKIDRQILTDDLKSAHDALLVQQDEKRQVTEMLSNAQADFERSEAARHDVEAQLVRSEAARHDVEAQLVRSEAARHDVEAELVRSEAALHHVKTELVRLETELLAIKRTRSFRLRDAVLFQPWSVRKPARIAYLLGAMATPARLRAKLAPLATRLKMRIAVTNPVPPPSANESAVYVVQPSTPAIPDRPSVMHVIANFMTGGSSRLVIDLHEYLSTHYAQSVVTSFIPTPPAYAGVDITEFRHPENAQIFVDHFLQRKPDLIHVHYWGDCDEPWYAKAMEAANQLGIPVIENINTPVAPFISDTVQRYVYVSDYVRHVFGQNHPAHLTVYPGSDFAHFDRPFDEPLVEDCVGMVYRLEPDKLNENAIIPFIKAVQKRPATRVLIVGGGSLLKHFQEAVAKAGLTDNFEFTGYVSYYELPNFYRRMSVFVAPVWKESFGQVSLFAMNMRVPVVGYDIGAISEILADTTLLAEPENAEMLSDIIVRLLASPHDRAQIGAFQRTRAQGNFSVQAMISAYDTIYQDVIAERVPK